MRRLAKSIFCLAAVLPLLVASCSHSDPHSRALQDLSSEVATQLEKLSPGDWILINPTREMETASARLNRTAQLSTQANHTSILRETLHLISTQEKLGARIRITREAETTSTAPGTARYRASLKELLTGYITFTVSERNIRSQLRKLPESQRVLIIRTNQPATAGSIAIELDYPGRNTQSPTSRPTYQHAELNP
ncbi:MAG: hypothetical protein IKA23_07335 [Akkermansia sp.]|nr:hypothetical protein [Akkermansia sp.]